MNNKPVLVAMSGGVDSSVAAHLLRLQGLTCVGATARFLPDFDPSDAQAVALRMGMDFHVLDLQQAFAEDVMEDFVRCYEAGLTPNPCVVCNRRLKFGALLDAALALGCDFIATGHYAQIEEQNGRFILKKAADAAKDQSYCLYALTQHQLSHTLFPRGGLTKEEARRIAQQIVIR